MRNPLYILQMAQLVEVFNEIDIEVDRIVDNHGSLELLAMQELRDRLILLLPFADSVALPRSVLKAGRDVGDFFYLLLAVINATLEDAEEVVLPTAREAIKYAEDDSMSENLITIDVNELDDVMIYRAKARETLRRPAHRYGLSVETSFEAFDAEEVTEEPSAKTTSEN
ncbi:MAG: hypothetical protein FWD93_03850 [Coriobacteriia bacterium]|nr:hypothetical protein [Coriobacteriia bacterium]